MVMKNKNGKKDKNYQIAEQYCDVIEFIQINTWNKNVDLLHSMNIHAFWF